MKFFVLHKASSRHVQCFVAHYNTRREFEREFANWNRQYNNDRETNSYREIPTSCAMRVLGSSARNLQEYILLTWPLKWPGK